MLATEHNTAEQAATRMAHASSRILFRHWETLRAERPCPNRVDFDLKPISKIVSNIAVMENKPKQGWTFRMAGSNVCNLLAANVTDHSILAGFDLFERDVINRVLDVAQARLQPGLIRMRMTHNATSQTDIELLVVPVKCLETNKTQLFAGYFAFAPANETEMRRILKRELISARLIWTEHVDGEKLPPMRGRQPVQLRVIQGGRA